MGRRAGKSFIAALLAIYHAFFVDYRGRLSPGEVATIAVIAADRKQARTVFRYILGLVRTCPLMEQMVVREGADFLELNNSVVIEVGTATHRGTRGYTYGLVICDEIAFWHSEGASPDREIINAVRPGLATLDGPLICLSSPYARRGMLWETFRRHYRQDSDILVARAPSKAMNPALSDHIIREAKALDPASAAAEYEAEFRNDIESFVDLEQLIRLARSEPLEIRPDVETRYTAFVDPAGGGADGFAIAIGHKDRDTLVVDCIRERARVAPAAVCAEYAALLRSYGLSTVTGDRYAGQWVKNEFERHGITYRYAEKTRTELYVESLSALNNGTVELPPMDKMLHQFANLERRTTSAGRDVVDHPPGTHDDLANAVAGLVAHAARPQRITNIDIHW